MILAIIGNKGGTAKTATAISLAAGLGLRRRRSLLIDLDSQGSASLSLGIKRVDFDPSIADVILAGRIGLSAVIRNTGAEGLDLVTGSARLADADVQLARIPGREHRLKEALAPIRAAYDFIVLDCPPSLGMLAVNALVAADAYLIPTPPEYLALEGLVGITDAVQLIQSAGGR